MVMTFSEFKVNQKVRMGLGSDAIYGTVVKINPRNIVVKWEDLREPTMQHPNTWKSIKSVN